MSGTTPELSLSTAVDADDNADYLTIALANSLRTVDGLFSNTTGHTHSGSHQGGPIGAVPGSAITDGSITSAKIQDGTIVATDIGDGAITTAKIAQNNITVIGANQAVNSFTGYSLSTTSATAVLVPGVTATFTPTDGTRVFVVLSVNLYISVLGQLARVGIGVDGVGPLLVGLFHESGANHVVPFTLHGWFSVAPGVSHTWQMWWNVTGGATLAFDPSSSAQFYAIEWKR